MSQFYIGVNSGNLPPQVPTSFITDVANNTTSGPGTAIPSANNLEILGRDTTQDNVNGIRTDADPNNGNFLYVELTNRFHGSATTVGATTADVITFSLGAIPANFFFNFTTSVFNASTPAGAGYDTFTTVRTDGITAIIVGDTDAITHEDTALITTTAEVVVSGNTVIFRVGGVAGLTINWKVVGIYIEVT